MRVVMEKYIYSEYIALPHLPLDIGENIATTYYEHICLSVKI